MSTDKSDKDISYKRNDIYISDSDDETLVSDPDTTVDTNGSDTSVNTGNSDTNLTVCQTPIKSGRDYDSITVMTPNTKAKRRYLMSPVLRNGYYGRKGARLGYRHLVSSALEYMADSRSKHLPKRFLSTHC